MINVLIGDERLARLPYTKLPSMRNQQSVKIGKVIREELTLSSFNGLDDAEISPEVIDSCLEVLWSARSGEASQCKINRQSVYERRLT